jgi:8-oxo-dGTP diphosphatase
MTFKLVLCSAAALIDADNRVLIQRRPEGAKHAGWWEFPGGKLEIGERPEQALVRELKEELDVTTIEKAFFPLSFISYTYADEGRHVLIPVFGCRNWTGLPTPVEGQELAWVKPPRLGDYKLLESNVPLIAPLCELI